jgi:hypothetical protein
MDSHLPSSEAAPEKAFKLKVALLHALDPLKLDEKRATLLSELKRVPQMTFLVYETFAAEAADAHFYLAHDSEKGHQDALDEHCEPAGAYYVLFSRSVPEIRKLNQRGLFLPARIVETRAVMFVNQWIRDQRFPGWEYLIGEPEKDAALEYLHQRLAGEHGDKALGRIEDLCLPAKDDSRVKELFGRLRAYHIEGSQNLHEIRELLLASDGLVARLVKLRREQE